CCVFLLSRYYIFFLSCSRDHPDLHSFPTRRSSDLTSAPVVPQYNLDYLRSVSGNNQEFIREMVLTFIQTIPPLLAEMRQALSERSEEHTSELQSRENLVCRLLLEKKKKINKY